MALFNKVGKQRPNLFAVGIFSTELQKSLPNQPSVDDILQALLKECRKENLRYKIVALRCTADVLKATQENRFKELTDIIFPIIKKVNFQSMLLLNSPRRMNNTTLCPLYQTRRPFTYILSIPYNSSLR